MSAQPGSDDEHYVFFRRLFAIQVWMMMYSRHFFLHVRLFRSIFGVIADDAIGSFEKTVTIPSSKYFQKLSYIDGFIEYLDDQPFWALQRTTLMQCLESSSCLGHSIPMSGLHLPQFGSHLHKLPQAILELRALALQKSSNHVVLLHWPVRQSKMTLERVCPSHLSHADQTSPTDIRVQVGRDGYIASIGQPD